MSRHIVTVPAQGDENGDGVPDPPAGGRPARGGRAGPCAVRRAGTREATR